MKKIIILLIFIVILLSCSRNHNEIIIGVKYNTIMQIPITTAVSAKLIGNENVKYFSSNKSVTSSLNRGKIDIAIIPNDVLILHKNDNIIKLYSYVRGGYGILATSKIKSLDDLKGKTVGVLKKTEGEFLLNKLKDSLDVKIKTYSLENLLDLDFTYEKIAAMVADIPKIITKSSLRYKIVFWFSDKLSFYPYATLVVNKKAYKKNKEKINDIISKIFSVGDQLMDSPILFFDTNEKIFKITRYKAKEISHKVRFYKLKYDKSKDFDYQMLEFFKEKGYIK